MPYYQTLTYSAGTAQASIGLDFSIVPFNASITVSLIGAATATYKLQYTMDPLSAPTAVDSSANWYDSPDIPAGTATSAFAAFITPVARVRLVFAAISGSVQIQVLQGLSTN
jgi:hypothetical protein